MSGPEQSGARVVNRPSGEDMPRWVTVVFVTLGTLLAIAAAWLALTEQPEQREQPPASPPMPSESVRETPALPLTSLAAAPAPLPITSLESATAPAPASVAAPDSSPATPLSSGADASVAPPPIAPADVPAAGLSGGSSDDLGQTRGQASPSPEQPLAVRDDCPPPILIPFKLDSARPITRGVPMDLNQLRTYLSEHPQAKLSIEGHADSTGAENYNLLLSYRRAKAVGSLLARAGMPEQRMLIRAAGDRGNIEGLPGESGENRRVVVQVIGIENRREALGASLP